MVGFVADPSVLFWDITLPWNRAHVLAKAIQVAAYVVSITLAEIEKSRRIMERDFRAGGDKKAL